MMKEKLILSWSGGKDSALALYKLQQNRKYELLVPLTTITEEYGRISMHGVREILLEQQAKSLGYPLEKVFISRKLSNEEYDIKIQDILAKYLLLGFSSVAFGDIFLEDVRKYREEQLSKLGMKGIFPLWGRNTTELAHEFIDLGFKAVITCVDSNVLDKRFVGRHYNEHFLSKLPDKIDPLGENGEFHSFVYDGPIFRKRILFEKGNVVLRDNRFFFHDLIPIKK